MQWKRFEKTFAWILLLTAALWSPCAHAQLVADGQTNILDGTTVTLTKVIAVGTNGTLTRLILTNGATIISSNVTEIIGYNQSAKTNRVVVSGPGSAWTGISNFFVGLNGSFNELDILDGGLVSDASGYLGYNTPSSNNLALISGTGSVWSNSALFGLGYGGSRNQIIVTNGGTFYGGSSTNNGTSNMSGTNTVTITGTNSSWIGGNGLSTFGQGGTQLLIKNGGLLNLSARTLEIGPSTSPDYLTVADPGSLLLCRQFLIDTLSPSNQCVISNGATLRIATSNGPAWADIQGTGTKVTVTGAGSVWTNDYDMNFGDVSNVLLIANGGRVFDRNASILSTTHVTVSGTNSLWNNAGQLQLWSPYLQLFITNGGNMIDNSCYMGLGNDLDNCYALVTGGGSVWSNQTFLDVGGQLVISNSGTLVAQNLTLQNDSTYNSNYVTVTGGNLIVTNNNSGNLYVQGGTLTLSSGLIQCDTLSLSNSNSGRFIFNAGTVLAHNFIYRNMTNMVVGNGTNAATLNLTAAGGSGGSHQFLSGLFVSSNALLTGVGTINGNIYIRAGGTFSPGTTDILSLTASNGLVLSNGSFTLLGLKPGTSQNYHVDGLTNVVFGGTLQLTNLDGGAYGDGLSFALFNSTHYSGGFSNIIPSNPAPGLRWDTNELAVDGTLRIFSTNTPSPHITGTAQSNGNVVISASGGISYDPCYLLTSTNVGAPISNWTCIATNAFTTNGVISFTNLINIGVPSSFYQLKVN